MKRPELGLAFRIIVQNARVSACQRQDFVNHSDILMSYFPDLQHMDVILPALISNILILYFPACGRSGQSTSYSPCEVKTAESSGKTRQIFQSIPNRSSHLDLTVDGEPTPSTPSSCAPRKPSNMVVPTDSTTMAYNSLRVAMGFRWLFCLRHLAG